MNAHLRANLWLLGLTVLVCCVLYPLLVWGMGRVLFPGQAEGSLVAGPDGKVVGSLLIAQSFSGDEYFQPRPSAVKYNASASGASNWGASNPNLRDRVARQLGLIARYKDSGKPVGPDVEQWFHERPDLAGVWAREHPTLAANWVKQDDATKDYVKEWAGKHADVLREWKKDNPGAKEEPKPEDLAVYFFASFAAAEPGKWPTLDDEKTPDGKTRKVVKLVTEGDDVRATFFDVWWQAVHADPAKVPPKSGRVPELESVPADMVMASGSGLDPHITVGNAHYQKPRVAEARAKKAAQDPAGRAEARKRIEGRIDQLLEQLSTRPVAGDEKIVNVLELNLALDRGP
jgi:K+-transporting ATPase ATPase C chain